MKTQTREESTDQVESQNKTFDASLSDWDIEDLRDLVDQRRASKSSTIRSAEEHRKFFKNNPR